MASDPLRQAVDTFVAQMHVSTQMQQSFAANPLGLLQQHDIPLPSFDSATSDLVNQSLIDLIDFPLPGSTTKRFSWSGSANSPACWSCTIGLNIVIWSAITAAGILALVGTAATDGLAAPAVIEAITAFGSLAASTASSIAATYGGAAALATYAGGVGLLTGVPTAINMMVNAACSAMGACSSTPPAPPSAGIWQASSGHADLKLPVSLTSDSPALATLGDKLYCLFKDNSHNILRYTTFNGIQWDNGDYPIDSGPAKFHYAPAAVTFTPVINNVVGSTGIYCVFTSQDDNKLRIVSTTDGQHWSTPETLGDAYTTRISPTLAVYNQSLYCAFKTDSGTIKCIKSTDGVHWTPLGPNGEIPCPSTKSSPALTSFMGCLCCSVIVNNISFALSYSSEPDDGTQWTLVDNKFWLSGAPAMIEYQLYLYCVNRGGHDSSIWWSRYQDLNTLGSDQYRTASNTSSSPGLAIYNDTLYSVFRDNDNHIRWTSTRGILA